MSVGRPLLNAATATRRTRIAVTAVLATVLVVLAVPTWQPAGASGILPPADPPQNVAAQLNPSFYCPTTVNDTSAPCIDAYLHDINYARSLEGVASMVLPTDYASLDVPTQQLVIANLERGDRGLSQFTGLSTILNAASTPPDADPSVPMGYDYVNFGSNYALDQTPLGADYGWMYDDGFGGFNGDCTTSNVSGCWGHRNNILGPWLTTASQTAEMGDGNDSTGPHGRYTQAFANETGPADMPIDPYSAVTPFIPTTVAPDVLQVSPSSSASTTAGTFVTIEGNYFSSFGSPTVSFGGVPATNVHVNWDGELTAQAPADPAGTAKDSVVVTVTTPGGTSNTSGTVGVNEFTYAPTNAPTITSVSPNSGPLTGGSQTVTITGTNLCGLTCNPVTIDFGGTQWSVGSFSDDSSHIVVTGIPAALHTGTIDVSVTTDSGTSAISAADQYTYTAISAPTVTSVSPSMGSESGGTPVTIAGTNFDGIGSVTFGGTEAESFSVNPAGTSISAIAPPGVLGTVDVVVTAEGGTSAINASDEFTYDIPVPVVTAVTPNAGTTTGGGSVTISGTGFIAGATVKFGSNSATVNSINPTAISAVVPAGSAGPVDVTVTTTGGTSVTSGADQYTYQSGVNPPTTPTISNLPASGLFGGGFSATVMTTGDGTKSVTTNSPSVCAVSGGLSVSYVGVGTCSLTAHVAKGATFAAADGSPQSFTVNQATPTPPTISNPPVGGIFGGGFTANVATTGDGTKSVTTNSPGVCTVSGFVVSYIGVGTCSLTAHVAAGTDFLAADGTAQTFSVSQEAPTTPTISNLPVGGIFGGGFTATVVTTGDGTKFVTSSTSSVCTASGLDVSYVGVGTCSLTAHVAAGTDFLAADGTAQSFSVGQATPTTPTISNLPGSGTFGSGFSATVATTGDGTKSVMSSTLSVCTVTGFNVSYVGIGMCSLTAQVANGTDFSGATGTVQSFLVGQGTPTTPTISNLPGSGMFGGGFNATVATTGDGTKSVTSSTSSVCTASGLAVSYVGIGTCSLTAHVAAGTDFLSADGSAQSFSVGQATPTTPTISNLPGSGTFGGNFSATVMTTGDGTKSVTSNSIPVCTVTGFNVFYVGIGTCSLTAHVTAGTDFLAADGTAQSFSVGQATPTTPTISNLPSSAVSGGGFSATIATTGDGTKSVTSNSLAVCTVSGGVNVSYIANGTCSLTAHVAAGTDFVAADGSAQTVPVRSTPTAPSISNLPVGGVFGGGFIAIVTTTSDGVTSVTSNSPGVCSAAGLAVSYIGVGTCSLTAQVAGSANFNAATGSPQTVPVGQAASVPPAISNLPAGGTVGGGFTATVATNGDGSTSVTSATPGICTASGLTVTYVGAGTCSLVAHVAAGSNYAASDGSAQTFVIASAPPPPPPAAKHGYWLVGSDGGIFTFGAANFFGSTGSIKLQRPVVGITPTSDRLGYWLVASDGGIFAFGDAGYFGSIPGLGLHPAGSGQPHSLNAPIVGMVPSATGAGYFMVASDGGVFAFGDAQYEGSCPGIGGCSGSAVGVAPDGSGAGYWLVTASGHVYTFGDAANFGAPGPQSSVITSIVRTPDGRGYWILDANGSVFAYGDAASLGSLASGQAGGLNPAAAIFTTSDGGGYWVVTSLGRVSPFGDAPNDGDISGTHLNGSIIAATGY